jgi:GGDEF domain-containing protein
VDGLLLSCRDISASKAFEEQLRHRAFHDPLTQLPNRALLLDRIEQAMARDRRTIALLFVDLDDFKVVNDTLGHAAGASLLTAVAARLRGCLRSADTAARLGGDEFALLLEEVVDPSEGERVASRVLDTSHDEDTDPFFSLDDYPATAAVLDTGEAAQVLASDPEADRAEVALLHELGYNALLMVPLVAGAQNIGVLEASAVEERPWSRSQIHSARIIGYQLAHVLDRTRLLDG